MKIANIPLAQESFPIWNTTFIQSYGGGTLDSIQTNRKSGSSESTLHPPKRGDGFSNAKRREYFFQQPSKSCATDSLKGKQTPTMRNGEHILTSAKLQN